MTKYIYIFFLLSWRLTAPAQLDLKSGKDIDFGYSAKATVEFSKHPSIRLGAGLGVGQAILDDIVYPSLHADFQVYFNGIGSARGAEDSPKIYSDITLAPTLTFGKIGSIQPQVFSPLLYFTEAHTTSLTNPYELSLSLGSNIVFLSKRDNKSLIQRVGFLSTKLGQSFQFYYYNDAGGLEPGHILSDGYDRYHTGGAGVVLSLDQNNVLSNLGVHIQKFTGHGAGAFDTANQMQIDFVNSVDSSAVYFNNFKLYATGENFKTGTKLNVGLFNNNQLDFQHAIHYIGDYSYHYNPYEPHFFIEGGWNRGVLKLEP